MGRKKSLLEKAKRSLGLCHTVYLSVRKGEGVWGEKVMEHGGLP